MYIKKYVVENLNKSLCQTIFNSPTYIVIRLAMTDVHVQHMYYVQLNFFLYTNENLLDCGLRMDSLKIVYTCMIVE